MLQFLEENALELKLGDTRGTPAVLALLQEHEDHLNVNMLQRRGVPVGKAPLALRRARQLSWQRFRPDQPPRVWRRPMVWPKLPRGSVEIVPQS